MPDNQRLGRVRITPSSEPSARAMTQAASETAMVQPRPVMYQSR